MNDADLELLLYRILSGKILFNYKNEQYELRNPSSEIRYEAQLLYNSIINDEKYNEWYHNEDIEYMLINLGLWSRDTKKIIKDLEKKIENSKVDLYKSAALNTAAKKIRIYLNGLKDQLSGILMKKQEFFTNTLEGYASSIKNEFIICSTLYKNNSLVFIKNANNTQLSYLFFNDLINELNKLSISIESFKKLARSDMWRSFWNCNKENIFSKSVSEWTDDQRTLVSMSRMYDNIYEHPECPDDSIIEDDDMIDGWMIVQRNKIKKLKKQAQVDDMNPKLKNAQEVFLMPQSAEEIEDIVGLNSDESLRKMKQRINYVKTVGSAEESQLPDVQMDLRTQMAEASRNKG
jgi:hypothetical protein